MLVERRLKPRSVRCVAVCTNRGRRTDLPGDTQYAPAAAVGPTPAQLVQAIDTSFASPLSMPRLSPFYVVALVLVGGVAVSLPALDLGMAAALAAAGIFVFVTFIPHVSGWFTASWVIGGGPGFLTAALALVAPLFRRRVRASEPAVIVTRAGEPVLFHLIERCARAVGAALPASCPSRRR